MNRTARALFIAAAALAAGLLVRRFALEPIYIKSGSMEPTLSTGHHLVLDKLTYRFREPARGEIICFASPDGGGHESVKRVIAVAGDTVALKKKKVFLNGKELYENYTVHAREKELLDGDNLGPLTVPPDSFFVLGDNRDNSEDSSVWREPETGERIYFLKRALIKGLVRGIY
jgi:signal peptidase I